MSISFTNPNDENKEYYQFEFVHHFKSIRGYLKNNKDSDFFEIEDPIFVDDSPSSKIEYLENMFNSSDNIIFLSKSQVLYYFKVNKN